MVGARLSFLDVAEDLNMCQVSLRVALGRELRRLGEMGGEVVQG